jgi:hypothetical protein
MSNSPPVPSIPVEETRDKDSVTQNYTCELVELISPDGLKQRVSLVRPYGECQLVCPVFEFGLAQSRGVVFNKDKKYRITIEEVNE